MPPAQLATQSIAGNAQFVTSHVKLGPPDSPPAVYEAM